MGSPARPMRPHRSRELESDSRNWLLRMRDRERKLLTKIDEAFSRIERRPVRR